MSAKTCVYHINEQCLNINKKRAIIYEDVQNARGKTKGSA